MLRKKKLLGFILLSHCLVSAGALAEDSHEAENSQCHEGSATSSSKLIPKTYGNTVDVDPQVTVHADYVEYLENNRLELEGQVEIIKHGYYARSDKATIDQDKNQASLKGNIQIQGPNMHMSSDQAKVDLSKGSAQLNNARFENPETGFRGGAELIDQEDELHLTIQGGSFTTCTGEVPDWSFKASEISLDQEQGFGTAEHARFNILDVPVLYVPWFTFPIDDRRKSGFLYPTIGSSNAGGMFVSTPYYLNLAPNYDATITPSWINGRGWHEEVELRHKNTIVDSQLVLGYIDEDKTYRQQQQALGFMKEDGERWGLSFDQGWDLTSYSDNTFGKVSFAEISDGDYLDDLDQGLQVTSNDRLDRRASIAKTGDGYRMYALLQEYQSLSDTTLPAEQAHLRLPELGLEGYQQLAGSDLDWYSQYVYFYRDPDDLVGADRIYGSRAQHRPKFSYPVRSSWGYMTPTLGVDHTDYYLEENTSEEKHLSRTVPFAEFDAGMYFDRTPHLLPDGYTNSVEPRMYYVYSDYVSQQDLPNFDSSIPSFNYDNLFRANRFTGGDRVSDENRLTLSLTSRYTDWTRGLDVLTVSLGQVSQFDQPKVSGGAQRVLDGESLIASEMIVRPTHNWALRFSNLWDASTNLTEESVSSVSYQSADHGTVLNIAHRYRRDEIEQSDSSVIYPVTRDVSLLGQWRYALDDNRTIGTLGGIEYTSCCWRIQFLGQRYLTDDGELDNAFLFRFQLTGLGGFGVDSAKMDSLIPGYKRREDEIN